MTTFVLRRRRQRHVVLILAVGVGGGGIGVSVLGIDNRERRRVTYHVEEIFAYIKLSTKTIIL